MSINPPRCADAWTKYKCAALPESGRIATDGKSVRLRIADFRPDKYTDINIECSVAKFEEILAAAALIGLAPRAQEMKRCALERDDNLMPSADSDGTTNRMTGGGK